MDPGVYVKYDVYDNRRKLINVEVLQNPYRILVSSLLWYNKFLSDLEMIYF